jgi:hypothetical protein
VHEQGTYPELHLRWCVRKGGQAHVSVRHERWGGVGQQGVHKTFVSHCAQGRGGGALARNGKQRWEGRGQLLSPCYSIKLVLDADNLHSKSLEQEVSVATECH